MLEPFLAEVANFCFLLHFLKNLKQIFKNPNNSYPKIHFFSFIQLLKIFKKKRNLKINQQ